MTKVELAKYILLGEDGIKELYPSIVMMKQRGLLSLVGEYEDYCKHEGLIVYPGKPWVSNRSQCCRPKGHAGPHVSYDTPNLIGVLE